MNQNTQIIDRLEYRLKRARIFNDDETVSVLKDAIAEIKAASKDRARVDFLKEHTHFEFWVHHPDYDVHGGKRFNAEGIVFREVVDSAIQWQAKQS